MIEQLTFVLDEIIESNTKQSSSPERDFPQLIMILLSSVVSQVSAAKIVSCVQYWLSM